MNNIDALINGIRAAVDAELKSCAEDLLEKAQGLAPVGDDVVRKKTGNVVHKGGTLADSGYVEERNEGPDVRVVVVGFDTRRETGGNFNYAIIQHEKPMKHAKGQWKFLETPYKENKEEYQDRISQAIGNSIGKANVSGGVNAGGNSRDF